MADFDKALKLNPKQTETYNERGLVRHLNGELKGALEDLNRSIELDSEAPGPYYGRGLVHMDMYDLPAALDDFTKAIERNPREAVYYAQRGLIRMRLLQDIQARQDFEACVRLNPLLKPGLDDLIAKVRKSMTEAKSEPVGVGKPPAGARTADGTDKKAGT